MKPARTNSGLRPSARFLPAWCQLLLIAAGALNFLAAPVSAQDLPADNHLAVSYTGQFIVTGSAGISPLLTLPAVTTNASFIHLEPALLSVSAERVRQSLYRLLGIPEGLAWQGKIYLSLHPALYTDENVTVLARPGDQTWSYGVDLPDVLPQSKFMRGLTGVVLLELANRNANPAGRSAEIPAWLIDGLSQQILQDELAKAVLAVPEQTPDSAPRPRTRPVERNLDPLTGARLVLRKNSALTFDQLCWPTDDQLSGNDGGVYHASAQLFVSQLLKTDGGPARLQRMLQTLPQYYNWQSAFQNAWHDAFPSPLHLEKWWALEVINFVSRDPGPGWTPAYSAGRLEELLTVAVAVRASSNALPSHAEITLQGALRELSPAQQWPVFATHLRDLRIAQLRMAPQFIALTDEYCHVLAGYLGEPLEAAPRRIYARHAAPAADRLSPREVLKKLDELDARRRRLEAALPPTNLQTSSPREVQDAS